MWRRVRFDRHELAGSFGDIGTDFPLIAGMILAGGLDPASVLVMFGVMQILSGLLYGLPVPAQPLKAVAVLVIAGGVSPEVLYGGGLAIGLAMLFLALTGLLSWLDRILPKAVIRGIQVGLGLKLAQLALGGYVPAGGAGGYALAGLSFLLIVLLSGSRRLPPAIPVIALGVAYALLFEADAGRLGSALGFDLPRPHLPRSRDVLEGFLVLGLAQLPLSLGNSVFATRQLVQDLFPGRKVPARKIALTYSLMNLLSPFFSGVPTCHGSGGLAGHHAFGGRTGGAPLLYGALYLLFGLFLSRGFDDVVHLFPLPVLGVILLFEGLALLRLIGDMAGDRFELSLVLLVGLSALALPYGFLVGLVVGTLLFYAHSVWRVPRL
ncbi:MAG: putative sulfate/molybdate transporter [Gemmatimonadota bacterium]